MNPRLAERYAKSLLDLAKERGQVDIVYKDVKLDHGYRMDLLVENKVVIETKTVEFFTDVHFAQVLTYLRPAYAEAATSRLLGNFKLGLLINFHVALLKNGIKRIIN